MACVQPGRASDCHQIHRAMRQERLKVGVRGPSVLLAEVPNLVRICPVDCCNVDRGNRPSSTCVRIRNVSAADQPDVDSHERSEEHTSELQSRLHLVCRLLLEKKKNNTQSFDSI